jgi:uncharacterized membrane protein YebE (DUF533 family)
MAEQMTSFSVENGIPAFSREETMAFVRGVVSIIAADKVVTEEERASLSSLIRQTGLSLLDDDVQALVDAELATPSPMAEIVAPVTDPVLRRALFQTLVEVALADGVLAPEEDARLQETAAIFNLNSEAAREFIEWTRDSIQLERRGATIIRRL